MKFVFFCHAVSSCWNNGNAHFLRGVTRELARLGHQVIVYEPEDGWSRLNAIRDGGADALTEAMGLMQGVAIRGYFEAMPGLDGALEDADVVVAHEWNPRGLLEGLAERRKRGAAFQLLFHDTHHRAITAPDQITPDLLDGFDGALVFGEALREVYLERALAPRVFTWHEAADTALFQPRRNTEKQCDLIWIGNWGDEERTAELKEFLIAPAARLGLRTHVHGVRYPQAAQQILSEQGIEYRGWLPNHRAPAAFAQARVTVHVPRGPYARSLPGIPTIRVFEALACGIPLICSPWSDREGLFPPGTYLSVASGTQMADALADVLNDGDLASQLANKGVCAIHKSHTCAHRAAELVSIVEDLSRPAAAATRQFRQAEAAHS
jgi:spore maturation protein CgeB